MFSFARLALSNLSIKAKLLLLATSSVAIALVIAFAGLATIDIRFIKQSKVDQLQSQAKMLAFNCAGVLTFQDEAATRDLLNSMEMYPTVQYACVYDDAGQVLAEYRTQAADAHEDPTLAGPGYATSKNSVEIYESVSDSGEHIGAVYIRADMSDLRAHIRRYLLRCSLVI